MRLEIHIESNEDFDNLTFASAIINICEERAVLNAVKVAKAILLEMGSEQQ